MKAVLFFALALIVNSGSGESPKLSEMADIEMAFSRWQDLVTKVVNQPTAEGVLNLGLGIRKLGREDIYPVDKRMTVREEIQKAIISLPNHADYFREELERAMGLEFEYVNGTRGVRVDSLRYHVYETLKHLPSPSVVELLGEMLDDDRDPWKDWPPSDTSPPEPNYYYACKALNRIGLVGAPVDESMGNEAEIQAVRHTWQLWYAQVKSGARTIRFEGDPLEYSLSGPVAPRRDSAGEVPRRTVVEPAAGDEVVAERDRSIPWLPITGSLLVLLTALGFFLKVKWEAKD